VDRRQRIGLGAALLGALLLRVLLVLSLREAPYFHDPIVDGAAYDRWAQEIATESFWGRKVFYQDPLYPYALGLFYKIFGRDLLWVRLVQCLVGTLGLWMLFEAARRWTDYRTAILALAMGALYKTMAFFDAAVLKDFLGVVAIEAALLLWTVRSRGAWLGLGAVLGLGTLVRGNMLLVGLAVVAFLALRREWRPSGLVLAGLAAAILPCAVRNAAVAGDFVPTTAQLGPNLYTGNNAENTSGRYQPPSFLRAGNAEAEEPGFRAEAEKRLGRPLKASEIDAYWRGEALRWIARNPGTFLLVTLKRAAMLVNAYEIPDDLDPAFMARFSWVLRLSLFTFGMFLLPLAAAGAYLAWVERATFAPAFVMLGAYAASILGFFVFARYRLPIAPILLLFAAYAVTRTARMAKWRMSAVPRTAAAVFAAALVAVNVPLPEAVGGHRDFRGAHYNLAKYYRDRGRHAEAAGEFRAAAALQPLHLRDPAFLWWYGEALEGAGRTDEAFERFAAAADLDRLSPEAPYKLGQLYLARGMDERAAERFAEAVGRAPAFAAAYLPWAEAERRRGRFVDALQRLEAGRAVAPADWSLPLRQAEIRRGLGQWKEAAAAAEEVLRLKPGQADAEAILREARAR
jgi:4-amino-4-deoxy-L-arabinose transferase-like glycosyltransferase